MINSRSLNDLDTPAREACQRQIVGCRDVGIEILVTSTWRDFEAQALLYAIGRTVQPERRPVTNAKPGRSWHQFKCAWDVVPLVGGKAVWDSHDPLWKEIVRIGKAAGAEAGAEWKSFPDLPHFQVLPATSGGKLTLDMALDRWNENGSIFIV